MLSHTCFAQSNLVSQLGEKAAEGGDLDGRVLAAYLNQCTAEAQVYCPSIHQRSFNPKCERRSASWAGLTGHIGPTYIRYVRIYGRTDKVICNGRLVP